MPLYQAVIPVRYVRPLLELVQSQQPADLATILRAGGVSVAELRGDATLTMRQFDALHLAAAATLGRTDLGFDLGDRIGYGSPAAFSTAFRNCSGTSPRTYRKAARGERASPGASRSDTL